MKNSFGFEKSEPSPEIALTPDKIAQIIQSRQLPENPGKDLINNLEIDGVSTESLKFLGSGGSKEVYDAEVGGKHFAVGICGIQDTPERIIEKWEVVLKEPENTDFLRNQGFYVNEYCQIQNIRVNGFEFPAIVMKRFQDHQFKIFDSKNIGKNNNPIADRETDLNDDKMITIMQPVVNEVARLIKNGIRVGRDNFNLCLSNGEIHLYFNDLGPMKTEAFTKEDAPRIIEQYTMYAVSAFINSVNQDTYKNNKYIHNMDNPDNPLQGKLESLVQKQIALGSEQ